MTIAAKSQLLTADEDFKRMVPHCGLRLHGCWNPVRHPERIQEWGQARTVYFF